MLTFAQACELAETWVRVTQADGVVIVKESMIKRPYGWLFFYQTSAVLVSGDPLDALYGNHPILVNRMNNEIRVIWNRLGDSIETSLAQYEAELPAAWMQTSMPKEP